MDVPATGARAGLLRPLVEAAVEGSTLELCRDRTYVGRKGGVQRSRGTWSLDGARLSLCQTHEDGEPAPNRGDGRVRDGVITLDTTSGGLAVTLVFTRRR